ncbi:hypothetical protein ACIQXM_01930 [Arthrobacter sp. NPDC097144]|uniref:DUF6414 family protein n=1 Tax=Arthrobacter sp. NPDC097144 TaxID=3363946 RepID=UPI0037F54905
MKSKPIKESATEVSTQSDLFSLVIYQNTEYVSALLQQLFNIGLPIEQLRDTLNESIREQATEGNVAATFGAEVRLPVIPVGVKAGGTGDLKLGNKDDTRSEDKTSLQSRYTQANYLHNVRQKLQELSLVTKMTDRNSLDGLAAGSFVEFSASFEPNEINSLLDLAAPELVAAITKKLHREKALKNLDFDSGDFEDRQTYMAKVEQEAISWAEIAVATVAAIRHDFRNETTSEYFGRVIGSDSGRPLTAVTICDTEHFLGQDRDRILDGNFRVLGKVSEISYTRQSILSRNKVLNRIKQPALSMLQDSLKDADKSDQFDTSFKLYLQPPIIRVIPIAIFI